MSLPDINPEPIDTRLIAAAAGSVFTGERKGMSRWTPRWGGRFSRADVILLTTIAIAALVVLALVVF